MIRLHQFERAFGLPNPSPFCVKVETYLRLAELDYDIDWVSNPGKAPKGKCPFITDGDRVVADSHFILAYLKETYGDPLGAGLSETDRARHLALTRMMEEHLYFALLYTRWILSENAAIVREQFFSSIPSLLRGTIFAMVRRSTRKALHGQGCGRHDRHEIDCVAWGFIANALVEPFVSPVKDAATALPNLVSYSARMKERVFPEL